MSTKSRFPRCIGYGEFDNRRKNGPGCHNPADANSALLWCKRCEKLRREHITQQFAEINAGFVASSKDQR
jgi:hypothetical protein